MSKLSASMVKDMINDLEQIEVVLRAVKSSAEIPPIQLGTARAAVVTTRRRLIQAAVADVVVEEMVQ